MNKILGIDSAKRFAENYINHKDSENMLISPKLVIEMVDYIESSIEVSAIEVLIEKDAFSIDRVSYDSRWVIDVGDLFELIKEAKDNK